MSKYCKPNITSQSICSPVDKDTWYEGTYNLINWEIAYPYYQSGDFLNIYFYYQMNYQYFNTIKFENVNINNGYYVVYINNSFFPINNEINKKLEYMVIILPNNVNVDKEIYNVFSNYQKVDFYIVQNLSSSTTQSNTIIPTSTNTIPIENTKNDKLETWKIIVITLCCTFFVLIIILGYLIYKKKILKKYIKEKNINKKENNIIYLKPEEKEIKFKPFQKPNLLD